MTADPTAVLRRPPRPHPTGNRITMEGIDIYTVTGSKVVEVRSFWDAAAVYRQLALLEEGL